MVSKKKNKDAVRLAKLGAAKGGKARASVLTPEERSEIARKAVRTRWAKARGEDMPSDEGGKYTSPRSRFWTSKATLPCLYSQEPWTWAKK